MPIKVAPSKTVAADQTSTPTKLSPVTLALGGGAALGWAHIGVAQVFAECGLPIAAVVGTSIGAVAAACIADGKLDVLEEIARSATGLTVLRYLDVSVSGGGMLGGRIIERELRKHFGQRLMEHLALPCATVAADLVTGREVIIRTGSICRAVRASLAIPGVFTPVVQEGMVLADGGLINPVPVSVARTLSNAPVVAVQLFGNYADRAKAAGMEKTAAGKRPNMLAISRVSVNLLLSAMTEAKLASHPPDVLITPEIGHIDVGDFTKADVLIAAGRKAAELAWPQVAALISPHPDKPKK